MYIKTRHKNPFATMTMERKIWDRTQIIDKVWEILLYLTCLFPFTMWIPFLNAATDTQPYAVIVAFFCVIYYFFVDKAAKENQKMNKLLAFLMLICVAMGAIAILSIPDAGIARVAKQYVMYMSMILIPLAVFFVWKRNDGMNERLIKLCIWIWFLTGVMQKTVNPNFGSQFVFRQSTNAIRGAVGLATEPSAYGFYCFFVLLLTLSFKRNRLLYMALLVIQIFGLAESSVTVMYFGVYIVGFILNEIVLRKRFAILKTALLGGGGLGAVYLAYQKNLLPTRMKQLVGYAFTGNWKRILGDESIALRIGGIVDSFDSFVKHYGMPQGFGGNRAFSGVGILLVEGGIISIVLLFVVGRFIWNAYPKRYRFIFVFGFMITMLSAIPFSSPIVCLYMGYCVYFAWEHREDTSWD